MKQHNLIHHVSRVIAWTCLLAATHLVAASTSFNVPANAPWSDTGIDLKAGEILIIKASPNQRVTFGLPGRTITADGIGDETVPPGQDGTTKGAFLGDTVILTLIGKIGGSTSVNTGTLLPEGRPDKGPGFVGSSYSNAVPANGRLFLGFNDDQFGDNSGSFDVEILLNNTPTQSSPLLRNGDFELPQTKANAITFPLQPDSWTIQGEVGTGNGRYGPTYPVAKKGLQFVYLGYQAILSQSFTITSNDTYRLTWFDSSEFNGPGNHAFYELKIVHSDGRLLKRNQYDANASGLDEWSYRTITLHLESGDYRVEWVSNAEKFGEKPLIDAVDLTPDGDSQLSIRTSAIDLCWPGFPGHFYQVQASPALNGPWTDVGTPTEGTGQNCSTYPIEAGSNTRYFRILRLP